MSPDCILHLYDGIKDKNIYPHDFMLEYNCIHPCPFLLHDTNLHEYVL